MISTLTMHTPLGPMLLAASATGLTGAWFRGQRYFPNHLQAERSVGGHPWLEQAQRQLDEYFAGRLQVFSVPLDLRGTAFQRRVWEALREIPYGLTTTYGALAASLPGGTSPRAVGSAVGRNPVSVVVPCHRVVGHDGSLTGYAGGLERKQALLETERGGKAQVAGRW